MIKKHTILTDFIIPRISDIILSNFEEQFFCKANIDICLIYKCTKIM